mgnify:CR=1 FL=1
MFAAGAAALLPASTRLANALQQPRPARLLGSRPPTGAPPPAHLAATRSLLQVLLQHEGQQHAVDTLDEGQAAVVAELLSSECLLTVCRSLG